ncbi:MAG TPA: PepSY-associated TM helix domain-containing protein [Steroidobacteraceae bacterium]|nr:PepSY-associated TM helix domain-containing protein [Steroidobacteraceae bacterium]
MRAVHRIVSLFVVLITLYLGVTGIGIQGVDLHSLYTHVAPTDPNMMALREDHDGPGDFAVISSHDYLAPALPADFDYRGALSRLMGAERVALADAAVDYAEIRMTSGGPTGRVLSGKQLLVYDFGSGQTRLGPVPETGDARPASLRNQFKALHRMTTFNMNWVLWINPVVGLALAVFIFTGLWMYFQLLAARSRIKRNGWFWKAGGWWRTLHRWISLASAAFLIVVTLSGMFLAYESLVFGYYLSARLPAPGQPPKARPPSAITPLTDAQLPSMLGTSLDAWRTTLPGQPLKVLRLRTYGGMPQGIVIAGLGDDTQQVAFNATTGKEVSVTEPGYPDTGFPFGWHAHQIAKQIHRGSYLGLTGRWMDFLSGLALIFLSISGGWMYWEMWSKRRRSGRKALIWT